MSDNFWETSDGESLGNEKEFDGGGGGFELIPDGSSVLAMPDEAAWDETKNGDRFIKIRWNVVKPEEFANRKVFQKLWVLDDDPNAKDPAKKRDKAKRMLAAIDANAGGKLAAKGRMPTDDDLALALINKPMVIRVHEYEGQNGGNGGNWVAAVSSKSSELKTGKLKYGERKQSYGTTNKGGSDDLDDEVPF